MSSVSRMGKPSLEDGYACYRFATSSRENVFCALLSAIKKTEGQESLEQLKAFADFQRRCEETRKNPAFSALYYGEFEEYFEKVYTMWTEEKAKKMEMEKQENEIEAKLREVADLIKAKDSEYVSLPLSKGEREKRKRARWCAEIEEVARMAKKLKNDI